MMILFSRLMKADGRAAAMPVNYLQWLLKGTLVRRIYQKKKYMLGIKLVFSL